MNPEWNNQECELLAKLTAPMAIQRFLEECQYRPEPSGPNFMTHSPRWVMRERQAHCFEGALLAAAALQELGYDPLIVELVAVRDDEHYLAPFRYRQRWGAISKSNFPVLLFREPVYRTLRELVMSYFDFYFNSEGEKTLRGYSLPVNLSRYDHLQWRTGSQNMECLTSFIDVSPRRLLLTSEHERNLARVEERVYRAGFIGVNPNGVYQSMGHNLDSQD